jgi:hypothetical protein
MTAWCGKRTVCFTVGKRRKRTQGLTATARRRCQVAPRAGARIETSDEVQNDDPARRRSSCGGADRNISLLAEANGDIGSLLVRGRGSKRTFGAHVAIAWPSPARRPGRMNHALFLLA